MSTLIACLSTGKGTWTHVQKLINSGKFENIILVCNQWTKENYQNEKGADMIVVDGFKGVEENIAILEPALKEKVKDTEVGLNMVSGNGVEHMALLSTLLKLGLGIRLVVADEEGSIKEL